MDGLDLNKKNIFRTSEINLGGSGCIYLCIRGLKLTELVVGEAVNTFWLHLWVICILIFCMDFKFPDIVASLKGSRDFVGSSWHLGGIQHWELFILTTNPSKISRLIICFWESQKGVISMACWLSYKWKHQARAFICVPTESAAADLSRRSLRDGCVKPAFLRGILFAFTASGETHTDTSRSSERTGT